MMQPAHVQPASVLPSSAPPLREVDGLPSSSSRILKEHSGNRQQHSKDNNFTSSAIGYEQSKPYRATVSGLAENAWAQYSQPPAYHSQSQYSARAWSYDSHNQFHYGAASRENALEQKVVHTAKRLLSRFKASEPYIKYRGRQHKDDKAGEQKWPDHLEEAFFRALVKYPPMGRRKQLHKDKQRGRNELIADEILELTGQERSRKQVSSHIQVLKPLVEHDAVIMKFLSKEDLCGPGRRHVSSAHTSSYRRQSSQHQRHNHTVGGSDMAQPTMPDFASIMKYKQRLEIFEPTSFQMFVQQKEEMKGEKPGGGESIYHLHTYTQSSEQPLGPDLVIADWTTLQQDFPLLARINASGPLDCNVIVADASLAFPVDAYKGVPGVELGIQFLFNSRHIPADVPMRCHNSLYRNGQAFPDQSDPASNVQITAAEDPSKGCEASVKFGSAFWARHMAYVAHLLREAGAAGDEGAKPKEDVPNFVRGITATQEIAMLNEYGKYERILVILWTFRSGNTAAAVASQYPDPTTLKQPARVDSMYEYNNTPHSIFGVQTVGAATTALQMPLALQSPSEYENNNNSTNSSSGLALSSATWPAATSLGDTSQHQPVDSLATTVTDDTFDFNSGNINIAFDPMFDISDFDSAAFDDFDVTAAEFAADPQLEQYSQGWCEGSGYGVVSVAVSVGDDGGGDYDAQPPPLHAVSGGASTREDHVYPSRVITPAAGMETHKESYAVSPYHAQQQRQSHVPHQQVYVGVIPYQDHPSYEQAGRGSYDAPQIYGESPPHGNPSFE